MTQPHFDYIVVGAGSAGCVLAARLSEDAGVRVLLLEAGGPDRDPLIHIPIGVAKLWAERRHDWGYATEPHAGVNGRAIPLPRGKVLGGSSAINAMAYLRGNPGDYDRWAANGATGWSYADVLPYFKRTERWYGGADAYRGDSGPVGTRHVDPDDPEIGAILEAARAAGYPVSDDINGRAAEGFARTQATIAEGRRQSTARAYLRPARRRANLTVRPGALALRVLIERGRAVGVEYARNGNVELVRAAREVIVSCGAINSPQLLMISGIGDASKLRTLGLDVHADLPDVGANLQDHVIAAVSYARTAPGAMQARLRYDRLALAIARAHLFGTGPAVTLPSGAMGLLRIDPASLVPDLQFAFRLTAFEARPWWPGTACGWRDGLAVMVALLHPASRGRVEIASIDPRVAPRIHANFLAEERDVRMLAEGVRIARRVFAQPALDAIRGPELQPGPAADSDAALAAYVRGTLATFHHAAGTCRMGTDPRAVVDTDLRVRGVEALRVVDASVMPDLVGGNINACVLMIAERAADRIRGRVAT